MKLKKPAKDHRGEWDLVLDNEGVTVSAVRYVVNAMSTRIAKNQLIAGYSDEGFVEVLWPHPMKLSGAAMTWASTPLSFNEAIDFFEHLGVDTAPLEKLQAEKLMEEKVE